jgi:hypothetical protein
VDVLGFFLLLEDLGFPPLCSLPVRVGGGTVRTAHGLLAVPVPAVAAWRPAAEFPSKEGRCGRRSPHPRGWRFLPPRGPVFCRIFPPWCLSGSATARAGRIFSVPNVLRALLCRGDAEGEEKGDALEEVLLFEVSIDGHDRGGNGKSAGAPPGGRSGKAIS